MVSPLWEMLFCWVITKHEEKGIPLVLSSLVNSTRCIEINIESSIGLDRGIRDTNSKLFWNRYFLNIAREYESVMWVTSSNSECINVIRSFYFSIKALDLEDIIFSAGQLPWVSKQMKSCRLWHVQQSAHWLCAHGYNRPLSE